MCAMRIRKIAHEDGCEQGCSFQNRRLVEGFTNHPIFLVIIMKKQFLIFLDIDGTLIKEDQRPNTKRLPAVIQRLENMGFMFCLNSNRSFEDVVLVYKEFGLNGPIVLENGVYFKKKIGGRKTFLAPKSSMLRGDLVRATKEFVTQEDLDAYVASTDTVAAIFSHTKSTGVLIMINKFRLFTGSIHVYRDGVRDRSLAEKFARHLKKHFRLIKKDVDIVVTGVFGNIIIYPRGVSKETAFKKLRSFYPKHAFVMIGDDAADAEMLKEVDHFFAVGNAVEEARKVAEYVSREPHTKGVIEILKYMDKTIL
jgi:HAD superfamily hydrolase (TIGR01484 family)